MKKMLLAGITALIVSPSLHAATYKIEVQNLTRGTYFAPILVAAHPATTKLFTLGMAASANVESVAERGDITGVTADVVAVSANYVANPAGGLLAPGSSTMADLGTPDAANTNLTVIGMIVPSNDGFFALNDIALPTTAGTYVYMVNGYDAGTEGNDEIRGSGAPGVPGFGVPAPLENLVGTGGTGISGVAAEGFVHIHPGHIGDMNKTGGTSDLDSSIHRWLNPMARVTVTVQ